MGYWIKTEETENYKKHWTCSKCNHDVTENPLFVNEETNETQDFKFCPICGDKKVIDRNKRVVVIDNRFKTEVISGVILAEQLAHQDISERVVRKFIKEYASKYYSN
jgi:NAD-dependent SIR2 family protein deacetylase